jgi:diketogulonate reductase-like aldo/keto reductase
MRLKPISLLVTAGRAIPTSSFASQFRTYTSKSLSMINAPDITLSNGLKHPSIGFGTYKVGFIPSSASSVTVESDTVVKRTARECIIDALDCGYRFLECAEFYCNEKEVGAAIRESGIKREDLFLASKCWTTTIEKGPDAVEKQFDKTLSDLGTDYMDLYLIHWPVPGKHVEAYKKLQELQKKGKIKGIGVSNYAWEDYVELKEANGVNELPVVNQIEINPFLYRKNTIDKFAKEGIVLQSYRSLRDGKSFDDPILKEIASKKKKTSAQIMGRWCHQHGFIYIPKSVKKQRMVENAQIFDFELSDEEMNELNGLTNPEAINKFQDLYQKCVNRDTSKDGTLQGVKLDITID